MIPLRVVAIEPLNATLKRFVFEHADGGELPTGAPGAHVLLTLPDPVRKHRNTYSLVTQPEQRRRYEIIVRRVPESRGGSHYLHDQVRVGDMMQAAWPANLFPLAATARRHLLISGGIGVTPMLSFLAAGRGPFELHQFCRVEEAAAFTDLLRPYPCATIHAGVTPTAADLDALLRRQRLGTHLYTCGPRPMMEAVVSRARALGWPQASIHTESFGDHRGGAPIRVRAARSQLTVDVPGDQSILEALEEAGIDAPCLCRGGVCGECLTPIVEGEPEHRDDFLGAAERAQGRVMMICVSRARTAELVLDI